MTKLSALKRGIATMITVFATAAALEPATEPASAGVIFSDGSSAYVTLGCFVDFAGGRYIQGTALTYANDGRATQYQIWVWDQARGWQAVWGTWVAVGPAEARLCKSPLLVPR